MFRIDASGAVTVIPTPGAPAPGGGYFSGGDPGSIEATIVSADWCNAVQEEIAYPIEHAGLTLSKTDRTQLWQALGPGRLLTRQAFLTPGAASYTPHPLMVRTTVRFQGAGGGGGGTAVTTAPSAAVSHGGQGGHYGEAVLTAAQIAGALVGGVLNMTIGAGGNAGAAGFNNGSPGGNTTFGAGPLLQQPGGGYGLGGNVQTGNVPGGPYQGGTTAPNATNFLWTVAGGIPQPGVLIWSGATLLNYVFAVGGVSRYSPGGWIAAGVNGVNAPGFGGGGGGAMSAGAEGPYSGGRGGGAAIFVEEWT